LFTVLTVVFPDFSQNLAHMYAGGVVSQHVGAMASPEHHQAPELSLLLNMLLNSTSQRALSLLPERSNKQTHAVQAVREISPARVHGG